MGQDLATGRDRVIDLRDHRTDRVVGAEGGGPPWRGRPAVDLGPWLVPFDVLCAAVAVAAVGAVGVGDAAGPADRALLAGALVLLAARVWPACGASVHRWSRRRALLTSLAAGCASVVVLAGVTALVDGVDVRPREALEAAGALTAWVGISRASAARLVLRRRSRGLGTARTLVVGEGVEAERIVRRSLRFPQLGMDVVGTLGPRPVLGADLLGDVDDLEDVLAQEVVDHVVLLLPPHRWAELQRCIDVAEQQGKTVHIPLPVTDRHRGRDRVTALDGTPHLSLTWTPDDPARARLKRVLDIIGALGGLLVFAPLMAVAVLAIKLEDRGSILFAQQRVGLHGRGFTLLKLRTMVEGAEAMKAQLIHLNERDGITFKVTDDPRVTRVGRLLRRTSLDEVPQFLNVLRGDMSLVGPRPPVPSEVRLYDPRHRRRLSVKPGITGLWQVVGREDASFEAGVDLDLDYIDRWSLWSDVTILLRTVPAVVRRTGS